jgi:glycosyltransferase involved in cell wall biosynthesis
LTARYVSLSTFPVSREYRKALERGLGEVPEYQTLPELRRLSIWSLLTTLWSIRPHVLLLPIEEETSRPLISILRLLGAVTRARRIELVDTDLSRNQLSRLGAFPAMATLIWATVSGHLNLYAARRDAVKLSSAARVTVSRKNAGRVLYLKTNLWMGVKAGGSLGHVAGVVNALSRSGRDVDYVATEAPVMLDDDVAIERIAPPSGFGLPAEINLYRFNKLLLRRTWRAKQRQDYEFIYQRLSLCSYLGIVLSRRMNLPLVIEYNGSEVWAARNWGAPLRHERVAQQLEDVCLKHAHVIITVSQVAAEELLARGIEVQRIVTYPNCIDPAIFDPQRIDVAEVEQVRHSIGVNPEALIITFVGTFGRWHGAEVFAQAIRHLIEQSGDWLRARSVQFLFVGDGVRMAEVKRVLGADHATEFVHFTGLVPQAEAPAYLAASDIFVSPHVPNPDGTPFFGSPTKLFEYMAMNRCIIASRLEQIADVLAGSPNLTDLRDGFTAAGTEQCAVLVEPGDSAQLAAAIEFAVESPQLREHLARNARQRVLARYTWDKHVAAIIESLQHNLPAAGQ